MAPQYHPATKSHVSPWPVASCVLLAQDRQWVPKAVIDEQGARAAYHKKVLASWPLPATNSWLFLFFVWYDVRQRWHPQVKRELDCRKSFQSQFYAKSYQHFHLFSCVYINGKYKGGLVSLTVAHVGELLHSNYGGRRAQRVLASVSSRVFVA